MEYRFSRKLNGRKLVWFGKFMCRHKKTELKSSVLSKYD
ncbi:hypothetical protein GPLA_3821 [Paraglaciecola polaris LMG 21857]|uniref:Uncharacterized protein n=1 Tax=Paraglaciecola polaris LMG 21857 TaxID=1129793 RepID=K6ZWS8_9ALTE|nr:hypothetical protein GPLA_3821 [Paraglaciecola polaris LMG 21857]